MPKRILFVCLGNICRSPTAEVVLRDRAAARKMAAVADSAGTGDWHIGAPPYGPMQVAARARGYDLGRLRARQVTRADFGSFDLILAMDGDNLANLKRLRPTDSRASLALLTDYLRDTATDHVPDPYYTRDFGGCLDLIERAVDGLLDRL